MPNVVAPNRFGGVFANGSAALASESGHQLLAGTHRQREVQWRAGFWVSVREVVTGLDARYRVAIEKTHRTARA